MSGQDIAPAPARGISYRGLTEIVGLSISALICFGIVVVDTLRNIPVPSAFIDMLIVIIAVIVARSAKGAQDRDSAAQNIDAAAHAASRVTSEVKGVLDEHKAQIGALAQVIAQLIPAAAPVLSQLGYAQAPSSPPASSAPSSPPASRAPSSP
jgi:hypothetical protein